MNYEPSDELEPCRGTYDWDLAFEQNPDDPVFYVSEAQRRKVYGAPRRYNQVELICEGPQESGRKYFHPDLDGSSDN